MRILIVPLLCTLLAACGGDTQTSSTPASWSPGASLVYAYPYEGQDRVAPTAPLVLHFSTPVDAGAATFSVTDEADTPVAVDLQSVDSGRGVVLTPRAPLATNKTYRLTWSNLASADGLVPPRTLQFTTRAAIRGATADISRQAGFAVERMLPGSASFPFMDFSTLRLQLTQPIDLATLDYGVSVRLEDGAGALVPARVFASGPLLSIDPKQDLAAGQAYHLKLTDGLRSVTGAALAAGDYADLVLTPKQSGPRATMALQVPDSAAGTLTSPLTGAAINNVPIASRLLGNNSASQQAGNMYAELAFVPNFPEVTPLTMRRGNLLSGSSVDVKIVGVVPAGLSTDSIRVSIISDATGYMLPNPYSRAVDAPRLVYLTMDAAMSANNASANGAFNQDLLHIEVVGTAIVRDGKLVMDAVGVTELDVLGLDQAAGVLSFHLEGYQDQLQAPAQVADTTAPTLQSWLPGSEGKRARPGDPVILTFSEPIDPASLGNDSVQLLKDGVAQPIRWRADGSSVVLRPLAPLAHNVQYTAVFTSAVTDMAGNGVSDGSHQRLFSLQAFDAAAPRSPLVLATYPGFPCVTTGGNPASGLQGRCAGGKPDDDVLPLPFMPVDRSIQVQFSQSMNPATIQLGASCDSGSFRVERLDVAGGCEVVPGRLEVTPQALRFTPDQAWAAGGLYRYVLASNGNGQSATCGAGAICGSNGLPLQTQLLAQAPGDAPASNGGGPNLEIRFRGGPALTSVAQRLRGLPTFDVNANLVHDASEEDATDTGGGLFLAPNAARVITTAQSGMVTASNIGCAPGATCPEKQFLFLGNALDAEVADYDEAAGGVRVLIQPSQIVASSVDVYADTSVSNLLGIPVLGTTVAPTGPQVFRLRHAFNPDTGRRDLPITGILRYQDGGLVLAATLDLYLDEPALAPTVAGAPIAHNLHSYPLSLTVSGAVHFLPDGRMLVTLANVNDVDFTVSLTAAAGLTPSAGTLTLRIPQGTMRLEGVSAPIKQ